MKKLLAVGVIVLFLGLAIAPSINANISKTSIDSELVEITTEICGIDGVKPHTVSLSQEDAEEVDRLFDSIRERLNATGTREETEKIFNEAVVELDKYGLLGGLSVKQAQQLVTGGYQNPIVKRVLDRICNRNPMLLDDDENMFCLVVGKTDITLFEGRVSRYCSYKLAGIRVVFFGNLLDRINPIPIGHRIGLGAYELIWNLSCNATGWVHTNGLNGVKRWNGSLRGNLTSHYRLLFFKPPFGLPSGLYRIYQGVHGFSGIKIGWNRISYMGFASRVKISPEPL